MKKTVVLLMFLTYQLGITQTKPIVENHTLESMDLVLFTFGMDQPLSIGTISISGEINLNLPKDLDFITEEVKTNFMSDAAFTLFSKCNNLYEILSQDQNIKAVNAGYISMSTKDNQYSGLLFMVTDKNMTPWLEDSYSNNALIGSYFELVYVESDFNYQGECTSDASTENDTIITNYTYNLQLKAGFNFIEYKIESLEEHKVPSIYEENVFDTLTYPSKITVTSSQTVPNTKWIGKYF